MKVQSEKKLKTKSLPIEYFLFTRTTTKDYEFKNEFLGEFDAYQSYIEKSFDEIKKCKNSIEENQFIEQKFDNRVVYGCLVLDGRVDSSHRRIFSFFGAILNKKQTSILSFEDFKKQVNESKKGLKENSTAFDLAYKFPVNWKEKCIFETYDETISRRQTPLVERSKFNDKTF